MKVIDWVLRRKRVDDTTLKGRWINALRSGDYRQTSGRLRRFDRDNNPSYCCLGVLCDLVDPNGWDDTDDTYRSVFTFDGDSASAYLPERLRESVDIPIRLVGELVSMNDSGMSSFKDIADTIEKEWNPNGQ